MARHRRVTNLEEDKPELSISPLIDICFLLLIYFPRMFAFFVCVLTRGPLDEWLSWPRTMRPRGWQWLAGHQLPAVLYFIKRSVTRAKQLETTIIFNIAKI